MNLWENRRGRGSAGHCRTALGIALVILAAVLCLFTAVSELQTGREQESQRQLEDTLRRAAVACYAAEGIYPPDISYLEEHYGIQIDKDRFAVYYDVFASNLMPDITVIEKQG